MTARDLHVSMSRDVSDIRVRFAASSGSDTFA